MRIRAASISLAFAVALGAAPPAADAVVVQHFTELGRQPVAPGVRHAWGSAAADAGPQNVHLVSVAPDAPGMLFETGLAAGRVNARQRTTAQALAVSRDGHRVVAAVNGDIWGQWATNALAPRGLNVRHGELVTAGSGAVPAFGVDVAGRARIGTPTVTVGVRRADGSDLAVNRVNGRRFPDETVLYTPRFDTRTLTDATGTEVVLSVPGLPLAPSGTFPAVVREVRVGAGDTPLAAGTVVLSGVGSGAAALGTLSAAEEVTIEIGIDAGWENVRNSVGGPELLLRHGSVEITPFRESRVVAANPRTAVGVTAGGEVLMLTVDGRSTESGGLRIDELADVMRDLGAVDALNLDGGGSTTMAVRAPGQFEAALVNSPSDGNERSVSTTLQLVSTTVTGPLSDLVLSPPSATIYQGQQASFAVSGHDAAYNGIPVDRSSVTWSTSSSSASVSGGVVGTSGSGEVDVIARVGSVSGRATVTILPDKVPPAVTRPAALLPAGKTLGTSTIPVEISWQATDAESGVRGSQLQQRVNGGSWASISLPTATTMRLVRQLQPGRRYEFRSRATDAAGNVSPWVLGPSFRLVVHQESSTSIARSGGWSLRTVSSAYGGRYMRSRTVNASASLQFGGAQVAWVGYRGPSHGRADLFLDGVKVARAELGASSVLARRILWASPAGLSGSHTLSLTNVSLSARPIVDVDAFVILLTDPPATAVP